MTTSPRNLPIALAAAALLALPGLAAAQDPTFTLPDTADRVRCTFTTVGSNPYLPLWPGLALLLEGEEEDDGEILEIASLNTVLPETELVDGVLTRVYEERESEDGELVEVSRNWLAFCRETGDVWYFGESVIECEDGDCGPADDSWRSGVDGARPGILMPGSPMVGARHYQEYAPGVAEDQAEVVGFDETVMTPAGTFEQTLHTLDYDPLDPEPGVGDEKAYAWNVGNVVDETLELVEITYPDCIPDATTHCLNDGRFRVSVEWEDFDDRAGQGQAMLPSDDSGEFWFFEPNNTELVVKVIDACVAPFDRFWVFAAGLTNVEVTLTVEDTESGEINVYTNPLGADFQPVLDTAAFDTCP